MSLSEGFNGHNGHKTDECDPWQMGTVCGECWTKWQAQSAHAAQWDADHANMLVGDMIEQGHPRRLEARKLAAQFTRGMLTGHEYLNEVNMELNR